MEGNGQDDAVAVNPVDNEHQQNQDQQHRRQQLAQQQQQQQHDHHQQQQQQLFERPLASRCSLYDPSVAGSRRSFFSLPYSARGSQTGRETEFPGAAAPHVVPAGVPLVPHQPVQHVTSAPRSFIQHTTCASCRSTLGSGRPSSNSNSSSFREVASRSQLPVELEECPLPLSHFCLPSRQYKQQQQQNCQAEPMLGEAAASSALSSYLAFQEAHESQDIVSPSRDSSHLYTQSTTGSAPLNRQHLSYGGAERLMSQVKSCTCSYHSHALYPQLHGPATMYTRHDARLYIPVQYPHAHPPHSAPSSAHLSKLDADFGFDLLGIDQVSDIEDEYDAVRASSAKAIHGSCSSGSEECKGEGGEECCSHLSSTPSSLSANAASSSSCSSSSSFTAADTGLAAANSSTRSMYGSSGHKDSSDVSSFDSNFYRGKSSSSSSDEKDKPAVVILDTSRQRDLVVRDTGRQRDNVPVDTRRQRDSASRAKGQNGFHSSGAYSDSGRGRSRSREQSSATKGLARVHTHDWGSLSKVNAERAALLRPSCLPFSRNRSDFYDGVDPAGSPDRSRSRIREQERQALLGGNKRKSSSAGTKSLRKDALSKEDSFKNNRQERLNLEVNRSAQGSKHAFSNGKSERLKADSSVSAKEHGSVHKRLHPLRKDTLHSYKIKPPPAVSKKEKPPTVPSRLDGRSVEARTVPNITGSHLVNLRHMLCRLNRRESSSSPCLSDASTGTCSWGSSSPSHTQRSSASSMCSSCGQVVLSSIASRLQHNEDDLQDFTCSSENGGSNSHHHHHVAGGGEGLAILPPGTSLTFTAGTSESGSAGYKRAPRCQPGRSRSASARASRNPSSPSSSSSASSSSSSSSTSSSSSSPSSSAFYSSKPKRTQSTPGKVMSNADQPSREQTRGVLKADKHCMENAGGMKSGSASGNAVGFKHDHSLTKTRDFLPAQIVQTKDISSIKGHYTQGNRQVTKETLAHSSTVFSNTNTWKAKAVTVHEGNTDTFDDACNSKQPSPSRLSQKPGVETLQPSVHSSNAPHKRMMVNQALKNPLAASARRQQNYQVIEQCNVCHKRQVILATQHSPLASEVMALPAAAVRTPRVCQMCHRGMPQEQPAQHTVAHPKHSMVLFTEAQGWYLFGLLTSYRM